MRVFYLWPLDICAINILSLQNNYNLLKNIFAKKFEKFENFRIRRQFSHKQNDYYHRSQYNIVRIMFNILYKQILCC